MKIVIFVSYSYPFIGSGIGQVAMKQAEGLAKASHDVCIISSNTPYLPKTQFTKNNVDYLKINCLNFLYKFHIPVPLFLLNMKAIKKIYQSNIVHAHDMLYPSSLQAGLVAKLFGKKFVLTQHVGFVEYPNLFVNMIQKVAAKTIGRFVCSLADAVIFVNEGIRNEFNLKNKNVFTLTNGIDTKLFNPPTLIEKSKLRKKWKVPLNKKIVLFVGRLVPKKGFNLLLLATSKKYFIVLAGGGKKPPLKLSSKEVLFTGELPQEKLSQLYKLSDIFVLPSKGEGLPLSVQEAIASGLPVITTNNPGYQKYLNYKFVRFVDSDAGAIKKAILSFISNKKVLKDARSFAQRSGLKNFSWENNVKNLIKIYETV